MVKAAKHLGLTDLVDVSILQEMQDLFVRSSNVSARICDLSGKALTKRSTTKPFCKAVLEGERGHDLCAASNREAARYASHTGVPHRYVCHAGMAQFAAPILLEGRCVGTILMGDRPWEPLSEDVLKAVAEQTGADLEKLRKASEKLRPWPENKIQTNIRFLQSLINTVVRLCQQGVELEGKIRELSALFDVSNALRSTLDLSERLSLIARNAAEVVGAKGCAVRLLGRWRRELTVKAVYNLGSEFLSKEPILAEESQIDSEALNGNPVVVEDVQEDDRVLFPDDLANEGIRSMLCVGMHYQDKPIGTIHAYSNKPQSFTSSEIEIMKSLANQAAVAIENARLYQAAVEKRNLEREISLAGDIQLRLLPQKQPERDGVDMKGMSMPCKMVGGDFFDFIPIDDSHMGIVIADVSGKGVPGAILMASTRSALRALIESGVNADHVIERLNHWLCRDTSDEEFVALVFGVLNTAKRRFTYTNAGHNAPLWIHHGETRELDAGGTVLGVSWHAEFEQERIQLASGDVLLFYTDGVSDAMGKDGEMFSVHRLKDVVRRCASLDASEVIADIHFHVSKFAGAVPKNDDRTVVVVKVE
ncbi:MAG: SpoIIE family protein phosphatase [Planctomycetes bacterium]|nr:SpoIIE family protein phosphatase [Planctomycetota bacterium]